MKGLTIIFFCTWKFAATFPIAIYIMKMSFTETLIYTNIGGILGTFTFIYFSDSLIKIWNKYWPEKLKLKRKTRKIFTQRNRRLVKIKLKYGLFGIAMLSPVILSIPVGSFLTVKYYGIKKTNIIWLIAGQVFWSLVYTFFYTQIKTIITWFICQKQKRPFIYNDIWLNQGVIYSLRIVTTAILQVSTHIYRLE